MDMEPWDDDDTDDEGDDDESRADPSCVTCGGQGGWCSDFDRSGLCIWTECDCVA